MFGCTKTYKVDYQGKKESFTNAENSYVAGRYVSIWYKDIARDTDYKFIVDGEEIDNVYDNKKGYEVYFRMPKHDVVIEVIEIPKVDSNQINWEYDKLEELISWPGKYVKDLPFAEEAIDKYSVSVKGKFYGVEAEANLFLNYNKQREHFLSETTIYVDCEKLDFEEALRLIEADYGTFVDNGVEPFASSVGGAVEWHRIYTGTYCIRVSKGSENDWYQIDSYLSDEVYTGERIYFKSFYEETGYKMNMESFGFTNIKAYRVLDGYKIDSTFTDVKNYVIYLYPNCTMPKSLEDIEPMGTLDGSFTYYELEDGKNLALWYEGDDCWTVEAEGASLNDLATIKYQIQQSWWGNE